MKAIAQRFDEAAPHYDKAATLQAQVAERLIAWTQTPKLPHNALDIGSGTGFVSQQLMRRWPMASLSALDISPSMLRAAQKKIRDLKIISGDAAPMDPAEKFDVVFSSMALHWLAQPLDVLKLWQGWLNPDGRLYVALLTEGSFKEWRDLCCASGLTDGLWPMPSTHFADDLATRVQRDLISISYPSASEFLHRLKNTGAATARPGHVPFSVPVMRRLMDAAPHPFTVSYEILYLELTPGRD